MILNNKTLEKLRQLINEEIEYRSGYKLVQFFNQLGFNDTYGQGFPSRWKYTDEKLKQINGTPAINECIKMVFEPQNFIGNLPNLDKLITEFNQYLAFDDWRIVRENKKISFERNSNIDINKLQESNLDLTEEDFINKEYKISLDELKLQDNFAKIIQNRLDEINV